MYGSVPRSLAFAASVVRVFRLAKGTDEPLGGEHSSLTDWSDEWKVRGGPRSVSTGSKPTTRSALSLAGANLRSADARHHFPSIERCGAENPGCDVARLHRHRQGRYSRRDRCLLCVPYANEHPPHR